MRNVLHALTLAGCRTITIFLLSDPLSNSIVRGVRYPSSLCPFPLELKMIRILILKHPDLLVTGMVSLELASGNTLAYATEDEAFSSLGRATHCLGASINEGANIAGVMFLAPCSEGRTVHMCQATVIVQQEERRLGIGNHRESVVNKLKFQALYSHRCENHTRRATLQLRFSGAKCMHCLERSTHRRTAPSHSFCLMTSITLNSFSEAFPCGDALIFDAYSGTCSSQCISWLWL